jgi:hypothetical protein
MAAVARVLRGRLLRCAGKAMGCETGLFAQVFGALGPCDAWVKGLSVMAGRRGVAGSW